MAIGSSVSTVNEQASVNTISGSLGSGVGAGWFAVAEFAVSTNGAGWTAPTGWTPLHTALNPSTNIYLASYYRVLTGGAQDTPTASWTTANRATVITTAWPGVDTTTPLDVTPTTATGAASSLAVPSITPVTRNARLVSGAGLAGTSTTPLTKPSTMTELASASAGNGRESSIADEVFATPGATGTRTWTQTGTLSIAAWLAALRPAAVAAGVTLAATSSLTVGADRTAQAAVILAGVSTLAVAAQQTGAAAVTLASSSALTVSAAAVRPAAVTLASTSTLTADGRRQYPAAVTLAATSTLTVGPALRTAAVAVLLPGTSTLTLTATAAAAGQLNVSLWGVDRQAGNQLVPLPHFTKLSLSDDGGVGSLTVEYPAYGRGYGLLARDVAGDSDLEVEIWLAGRRNSALRGYLAQRQGDDVAEQAVVQFAGTLVSGRADEALIEPQSTNSKKEYRATAATPGAVILQLLGQAQARGALTDITTDFTSTVDSAGAAWTETLTATWPSSKTSIQDVLGKLRTLGLVDSTISPGKVLRLWRFGTRGVNRATGTGAVTLRRGVNIAEATHRASSRDGGTTVYGDGADGLYATADNPTALARRGRRIERSRSYGNLNDTGALLAAVQKDAAGIGAGDDERTFGLTLGIGHPRPWLHFGVGDTVAVDVAGTLGTAPIAQMQLTVDSSGVQATAVAGDLIASRAAALAARLAETQQGGVTIGTSVRDRTNDDTIPNPPTGLLLSSQAYREGGQARASLRVTWTPPVANTDGSLLDDLSGYRLELEYASQSGRWEPAGTPQLGATDAYVTTTPGTQVRVRLAALDYAGHVSSWATSASHVTAQDAQAPPTPSTPVLSMRAGVVVVDYDGRGSAGEAMPGDTATVEVHRSAGAGFSPDRPLRADGSMDTAASTTYLDAMPWVGGQVPIVGWPYGTTVYVRLVAVDQTNNASGASAVASITVGRSVSDDVADSIVTAAKLAAGAVTTPAIAPEAVTTQHLSVAAFSDNLARNGSFEDPDTADPTQPAGWYLGATSGATATLALDTTIANVDGGSRSARIDLTAASGTTRLTAPEVPVRPGDTILVQVRVKASRAVAGLTMGLIYWPRDPSIAGTGGQITTFPAVTLTTGFTLVEQTFSVPANLTFSSPTGPPSWMAVAVVLGGVSGDSAALTVWVDEVRLRKTIGSAEIQDLAVGRAKIANLAVGDAQIETLTVGKLTAGTLSAAVLLSGSIKTATSGARFEADNAGIRLYNSAGTATVNLSTVTGTADIIGTVTSGTAGRRVRLSGTDSEIQFFPQTGETRKARIYSYIPANYPNDIALEMRAIDSDTTTYIARFYMLPAIAEMTLSPLGTGGDGIGKNGVRVETTKVSIYSGGIVGSAPYDDTDSYVTADLQLLDSAIWQAGTYDTGGTNSFRNILSLTSAGITGEVRNGSARDGGFLWLRRGSVDCYFGLNTTSLDMYLRFGTNGALLKGLGTTQLLMNSSGQVELRATSNNRVFLDGSSAQLIQGGTVKSFVIPHPTDEDRWLVHACTEGPDAGVEYRGTAVIADHLAVVELPPYFEALCEAAGQQVFLQPELATAHGGLPMIVSAAPSTIRGGRFQIVCPAPDGTRVHWVVKATRRDAAFTVEPRRDQVTVRGDGPYRYLSEEAA